MTRRRCAVVLSAAMTVSGAGCSFLFTAGPPTDHAYLPYFECTTSNVAPVIDTVFTAIQFASLLYVISRPTEDYRGSVRSKESDTLFGIAWLGVYGASATTGFGRVSRCKEAKAIAAGKITPRRPRGYIPSSEISDGDEDPETPRTRGRVRPMQTPAAPPPPAAAPGPPAPSSPGF